RPADVLPVAAGQAVYAQPAAERRCGAGAERVRLAVPGGAVRLPGDAGAHGLVGRALRVPGDDPARAGRAGGGRSGDRGVTDLWRKAWVRLVVVVVVVALIFWALYRLSGTLMPFYVAFALAYFLNPVANWLERVFTRAFAGRRLLRNLPPRGAAVGVLALLLAAVVTAGVLLLVPAVYHQITDAVAKLPEYLQVVRRKVEPLYQRLNLRYPEQTRDARQPLLPAAKENVPQLLSPITQFVRGAFSSLLGFVLTVLNLVIIPVFTFYLLYDMNHIRQGLQALVA